jgi:hypothetical protein
LRGGPEDVVAEIGEGGERGLIMDDQLFCACKARKGEGNNIQVTRQFKYQRFKERAKTI